jgi:NADPH:quinone reductase-like Zn-dependent oxidoreductase
LSNNILVQTPSSVRKVFVELGPHSALAGPTRQVMSIPESSGVKYTYLSCLSRGQNAIETVLDMSGKLFEQGIQVDLKAANALSDERTHKVVTDLCTYAWDHTTKYWTESRLSKDYRMRSYPPDELLGNRIPATSHFEPTWRNVISADNVPWVQEHIIDNFALFPGSAYLCMAMQALTQILNERGIGGTIERFVMRDIIYSKALIVPNAPEKLEIQLSLRPSQGQADKGGSLWQDFRLTSVSSDGVWSEHCRGSITAEFEAEIDEVDGTREQSLDSQMAESVLKQMNESCPETVDTEQFYDGLRENGIDYGDHFSILKEIKIGDCKTLGTIGIPDMAACMPANHQAPHVIHPATMDAVMHIVLPLYSRHCSKGAVMLISVDEVTVSTKILKEPGQELTVACNLSPAGPRNGIVNWKVFQLDEQFKPTPVLTLSHGEFRGIGEAATLSDESEVIPTGYQVKWDVDADHIVSKSLASAKTFQAQLAQTVKQLSFKKPHLKILEVGAGSGETTISLLKALTSDKSGQNSLLDSYTFSDTSVDTFDTVKSELKPWKELVSFKALSLDSSPLEQGFEKSSFDLIVATDLSTTTSSLAPALTYVKALLKSDGHILLGDSKSQLKDILEASAYSNIREIPVATENSARQMVLATVIADERRVPFQTASPPVKIFLDSVSQKAWPLRDQLCSALSLRGVDTTILTRTKFGKANTCSYAKANPLCVYISGGDQDPELAIEQLRHILNWSRFIILVSVSERKSKDLPVNAALAGFAHTIRKEYEDLKLVTVNAANTDDNTAEVIAAYVAKSIATPVLSTEDTDYTICGDKLLIPRLVPVTGLQRWIEPADTKVEPVTEAFHQTSRPLKVHVGTPGLLNSLVFIDNDSVTGKLADDEVEVQTMALGVNQNDVLVALGRAKPSTQMIGEFAGIITAVGSAASSDFHIGQRVCGWSGNAYASRFRLSSQLLQPLPEALSFSQGASIPLAFEVAYQALIETARLEQGQTVLIHSAAGAVGQAAVMIAQHVGAQVFATVGSSAKRQLLTERYHIPETHIYSSRTLTFKKGVLDLTGGKGVDVILNSLSGDMITDTWGCIAEFGTFIEVGSPGKHQLSMQPFERNVTLASIDLALMKRRKPQALQKILKAIINMMSVSELKPVYPLTELPLSDIETAFRQIQARKHTGKIVLTCEDVKVPALPSKIPALKLEAQAAYIVVDKFSEIGGEIASFLAASGSETIALVNSDSQLKAFYENGEHAKVKGVIHVDTNGKAQGVINEIASLDAALKDNQLDFFITISSISDTVAANSDMATNSSAWKEAFVNSKLENTTKYVSLVISPPAKSEELEKEEYLGIDKEYLVKLLNFAIQGPVLPQGSRQIWMGLQKPAIAGPESFIQQPLFNHVAYSKQAEADTSAGAATMKIDEAILAADSPAKVVDLITEAVTAKIASLVAMDQEDISLDAPVANFGLDSLIAIEFKNWIGRVLMAPMQTSEILDVPDIVALAGLIAQRTTISKDREAASAEAKEVKLATDPEIKVPQAQAVAAKPILPKLPLNDLESFLNGYYESVRGILSEEDLTSFHRAIDEFKQPGGIGETLQARLVARASDPTLANWNSEQYVRESFLDRRYPVVPYSSFFFTHPEPKVQHTQAERAALIAVTAFKHKQTIDDGKLEQQYLNERPLCMRLFDWIFNTAREPCLGSDEMHKFPGYNHIVVFRHGHAFKVDLMENGANVPFAHLRDTFEDIINHVGEEVEWAGILTSDDRDNWAKNRVALKSVSKANEDYLNEIDTAAFVINLDDAAPTNASDRAHHFHFGNGSNRWNDKSTQFAIATNGVSAHIGDHTMLDAGTVTPLNNEINAAIRAHVSETEGERIPNGVSPIVLKELKLDVPASLRLEIQRAKTFFDANTSGWRHTFWNYEPFGSDWLRKNKVSPNSAFQVIIQLAGLKFFGWQNFCWETVSVGHFDHGRVEVNPLVWPEVAAFCAAASKNTASPKELRKLFVEACKAHSNSVMRASQGKGTERHYKALGHMLQPGEPKPLLYSDPLHVKKIRSFDFMSSCFPSEMAEKGYLLSHPGIEPDSLWIHYEVYNEQ